MTGDPPRPGEGPSAVGDDGPVATFGAVVGLLRRWQPDEGDNESAPGRLQRFLDRGLNSNGDNVFEQDVVERRRGSAPANISVDSEIAITLVDEARQTTIDKMNVTLSLLADWYNFIAAYWLDPLPESIDHQRTIERQTIESPTGN